MALDRQHSGTCLNKCYYYVNYIIPTINITFK